MKIEFINKVWVKGTGKVSMIRKVVLISSIMLLFLSSVQFLLGGIDDVNCITGVVLPIVLVIYYRFNYNADGYVGVRCELNIENNGFHVYYYDVDYHDGNGTHIEYIDIPYENIKELQYSEELVSIRIISQPIVTLYIKGQEQVTDYRGTSAYYTCILYPDAEKLNNILQYISENSFVKVIYMD